METNYYTSDCAPRLYPVFSVSSFLKAEEDGEAKSVTIVRGNYQRAEWGEATAPIIIDDKTYPLPNSVDLLWLAITEAEGYHLSAPIDKEKIEKLWQMEDEDHDPMFDTFVVGFAPYGKVAVWLRGTYKAVLLNWMQGEEANDRLAKTRVGRIGKEDFCMMQLEADEVVLNNLRENGMPPREKFDNLMQQFIYRYLPLEEYWDGEAWQEYDEDDRFYDDIDIESIEDTCFDGTFDRLCDGMLLRYHEAGCPKLLALKWKEGRSNLSAYWWMDEEQLSYVLRRFASLDPSARADLLLRLDSRQGCFEMALKGGEMLQEPIVIPQEAYQLIVFKDGHELYKSPNFAQEDGAWNW